MTGRLRQRAPVVASAARVTPFPGASLRLLPVPSGKPRLQDRADTDRWKLLLWGVIALLLVTFVLTSGWFFFGRDLSHGPASEESARFWTPPASRGAGPLP